MRPWIRVALTVNQHPRKALGAKSRSALGVIVALWFAAPSHAIAGFLSNTQVTQEQLASAFVLEEPITAYMTSTFMFDDGSKGTVGSQVFMGQGNNSGINLYLYQITAPSGANVINAFVPFIDSKPAEINGQLDTSIFISGFSGASAIGGFTTVGQVKPFSVFLDDSNNRVLVTYASADGKQGTPIGQGQTGYIFGFFSANQPVKSDLMTLTSGTRVNLPRATIYTSGVPEPSSSILLLLGLISGVVIQRRGFSNNMRSPSI